MLTTGMFLNAAFFRVRGISLGSMPLEMITSSGPASMMPVAQVSSCLGEPLPSHGCGTHPSSFLLTSSSWVFSRFDDSSLPFIVSSATFMGGSFVGRPGVRGGLLAGLLGPVGRGAALLLHALDLAAAGGTNRHHRNQQKPHAPSHHAAFPTQTGECLCQGGADSPQGLSL